MTKCWPRFNLVGGGLEVEGKGVKQAELETLAAKSLKFWRISIARLLQIFSSRLRFLCTLNQTDSKIGHRDSIRRKTTRVRCVRLAESGYEK